ncbi:MAG TPA: hypothetical protein VG142_01440 [Trebonia sp.]|nr:hypothetical protein [Trebonia sp.]
MPGWVHRALSAHRREHGDGHVCDQFGEDEGLCPDPRWVAGRIPIQACGGTRKAPGGRR